jgi:hypothetical protein
MKKIITTIILILTSINGFSQSKAPGDTTFVDTISFEVECDYLSIDTSSQNIWEIGIPSQFFLDSAYTFSKAIMTDTNEYYPTNNYSYFDLRFINFQYPFFDLYYSVGISFKHKFDTDTLQDGGFITVSYDNGETWYNVIEDYYNSPFCMYPNPFDPENALYDYDDTLFQGEYGFSGNSGGWIKTNLYWRICYVKDTKAEYDTMTVRFNFISDEIDQNKEGWLIDDIHLFWIELEPGNVSSIDNQLIKLFPNPTNDYVNIESQVVLNQIEVYSLEGKIIENKKINGYMDNMSCRKLKNGLYILKLHTFEGNILTEKLLIKD